VMWREADGLTGDLSNKKTALRAVREEGGVARQRLVGDYRARSEEACFRKVSRRSGDSRPGGR